MSFSAKGLHARDFKSTRTVIALMFREMATTYGRSPGGYIWAVLEPVGGLLVMTIAFSFFLRAPGLGNNFPLFYASGYLPFIMYSELSGKISQSILFSRPLLFYPAVTYLDAIIARFLLNGLTQLMVFYILVVAIIMAFDVNVIISYGPILNGLSMTLALGFGVGLLNCFLFSKFPIWQRLWGIIMRPLMIVSCIFFLPESLQQPYRDWLWYNPLIHPISELRSGLYTTYDATWVSEIYVYGLSMIFGLLGLILLGRYHREILNN
jgi:capsular polysaccharide transport system permease protein